jgi:Flp pilus assembly protein protease CpaA
MLELSLILVALFVLIVASYVDIKILEVPDWINYAGIAAGLGIHLIFSLQQWGWWPIASSLIGLAIAFTLACIMFYSGQWGGGDAKLLMALGAIIGFETDKFAFGASFLINLVFIGGAWGLVWCIGLAVKNWKNFWSAFKTIRHQKMYVRTRIITLIVSVILIIASFIMAEFQIELLGLAVLTYFLCYLTMFVKSVELSSMHCWITPDKITEGDWLLKPVISGRHKIMPTKLGLEKKQVALIKRLYAQKKIDKILVKYGVPFAPAFLLAFIATMMFNNAIFALLF